MNFNKSSLLCHFLRELQHHVAICLILSKTKHPLKGSILSLQKSFNSSFLFKVSSERISSFPGRNCGCFVKWLHKLSGCFREPPVPSPSAHLPFLYRFTWKLCLSLYLALFKMKHRLQAEPAEADIQGNCFAMQGHHPAIPPQKGGRSQECLLSSLTPVSSLSCITSFKMNQWQVKAVNQLGSPLRNSLNHCPKNQK